MMEVEGHDAKRDAIARRDGELGELTAGARELCLRQPLNCFANAWREQQETQSCQQILQAVTQQ